MSFQLFPGSDADNFVNNIRQSWYSLSDNKKVKCKLRESDQEYCSEQDLEAIFSSVGIQNEKKEDSNYGRVTVYLKQLKRE